MSVFSQRHLFEVQQDTGAGGFAHEGEHHGFDEHHLDKLEDHQY